MHDVYVIFVTVIVTRLWVWKGEPYLERLIGKLSKRGCWCQSLDYEMIHVTRSHHITTNQTTKNGLTVHVDMYGTTVSQNPFIPKDVE